MIFCSITPINSRARALAVKNKSADFESIFDEKIAELKSMHEVVLNIGSKLDSRSHGVWSNMDLYNYGKCLLDCLRRLQIELLNGRVTKKELANIKSNIDQGFHLYSDIGVISDILTRIEIEIAKYDNNKDDEPEH